MTAIRYVSLVALVIPMAMGETLFVSTPLTAENSFTKEIEGPACDRNGNIYAVSFARKPTVGRITPDGKGEIFLEFTNGSLANGTRFDKRGFMYLADYTNHNVLKVDMKTKAVSVLAHDPTMNQPNDIAIGPDGTIWASDPNWAKSTGQVWVVDKHRKLVKVATGMGTTNGIEVSPDGKKLYVNESVQRKVWQFDIKLGGALANKTLLIEFPDHGFDGMRADVDGNLYITRHGKGTVVKVSPQGKVIREINVLGAHPTNLCFGGPDGRTCYVTEAERGRLVQFRVDRPGLEWQRWQETKK
ncbi:MAG: SMP-30/gluconolactonase/LRE family protein [Bryobacteraceae bacterium]